jgi:hypothetical protein
MFITIAQYSEGIWRMQVLVEARMGLVWNSLVLRDDLNKDKFFRPIH